MGDGVMDRQELINRAINGSRGSGQSIRLLVDVFENNIKELEEDLRNKKIAIQNKKAEIKLLGERCNQLLKDKGNLTDRNKELEQQNKVLLQNLEDTEIVNKSLEQQIEKMKCCGNCSHFKTDNNNLYPILRCEFEYPNKCENKDKWEIKENDN